MKDQKCGTGADCIRVRIEHDYKTRPRPCNLGFNILPSKAASDTHFLCCLRTNLAETLVDFLPRVWSNVLQNSAKSVQRQSRKGGSDTTSLVKIQKPKLNGRGLNKTESCQSFPRAAGWANICPSDVRGLPCMTSAKFRIFYPLPLVTYIIHATLFLLSAFWGHPPRVQTRTSYMDAPFRESDF